MNRIKFLFAALIVFTMNVSCSSQSGESDERTKAAEPDKVEVYYFHYTRRCATCNAVESVSKEAVAELYGDKVSFAGYNLDEPEGESKGKELGVAGQSLLIVSGNTKINITNEGFMNARSNPDKLKEIIKRKIDPLL